MRPQRPRRGAVQPSGRHAGRRARAATAFRGMRSATRRFRCCFRTAAVFSYACLSCATAKGELQVTIGQRGTRPTLASLGGIRNATRYRGLRPRRRAPAAATAGARRNASAAPAPAAAAAAATIRDSADPLEHGRYLVETIAGCGNCHTPRLPDGNPDDSKNLAGAFVIEEPVFQRLRAATSLPTWKPASARGPRTRSCTRSATRIRPDGTVHGPTDVVRLVPAICRTPTCARSQST